MGTAMLIRVYSRGWGIPIVTSYHSPPSPSLISCLPSPVSHLSSFVSCISYCVSRLSSPISRLSSTISRLPSSSPLFTPLPLKHQ